MLSYCIRIIVACLSLEHTHEATDVGAYSWQQQAELLFVPLPTEFRLAQSGSRENHNSLVVCEQAVAPLVKKLSVEGGHRLRRHLRIRLEIHRAASVYHELATLLGIIHDYSLAKTRRDTFSNIALCSDQKA